MFLLVLEWRGERCELDEWKILLNISPITICSLCILKNLPANVGDIRDAGLIHGSGRSPGGEHGNPLQYACLQNPHGQRSLVGYSSQGHKESDTTEAT